MKPYISHKDRASQKAVKIQATHRHQEHERCDMGCVAVDESDFFLNELPFAKIYFPVSCLNLLGEYLEPTKSSTGLRSEIGL